MQTIIKYAVIVLAVNLLVACGANAKKNFSESTPNTTTDTEKALDKAEAADQETLKEAKAANTNRTFTDLKWSIEEAKVAAAALVDKKDTNTEDFIAAQVFFNARLHTVKLGLEIAQAYLRYNQKSLTPTNATALKNDANALKEAVETINTIITRSDIVDAFKEAEAAKKIDSFAVTVPRSAFYAVKDTVAAAAKTADEVAEEAAKNIRP